jgi:ribosomal protein L40E
MKCPKCQAENPDEAEYCSLCYTRFQARLRSSEVDEAAQRIKEKNRGAKLRCPSCGDICPLDSQFCIRCGFVFDDLEALLVSEEEIERLSREVEEERRKELEVLLSDPITITAESDGPRVMRNLEDILNNGYKARIHTRGRNATTYAMKIIALMGEELRKRGKDIFFRASLITEGSVTDLEDVELEIILETQ